MCSRVVYIIVLPEHRTSIQFYKLIIFQTIQYKMYVIFWKKTKVLRKHNYRNIYNIKIFFKFFKTNEKYISLKNL